MQYFGHFSLQNFTRKLIDFFTIVCCSFCSCQFSTFLKIIDTCSAIERHSERSITPPSSPVRTHEETFTISFRGHIQSGVTLSDSRAIQSHSVIRRPQTLKRKRSAKTFTFTLVTTQWHDFCDSRIQLHCHIILTFRRYNSLTSMQTVIDSDRYLCITIRTIKRHDLGGYEEITTANCAVAEIRNTCVP